MKLSEAKNTQIEKSLEASLTTQAKIYQAQVEVLRDHPALPNDDKKDAILKTHTEHLQQMAETITEAYRLGYIQEQQMLYKDDIEKLLNRTSFLLRERLYRCVSRLPFNLAMSTETEGILARILWNARDTLSTYMKAMKLVMTKEEHGTGNMTTFHFVADSRIKIILERDYAELQRLDAKKTPKSVLVLCGSIIEGLLLDAIITSGCWTAEKANGQFLKEMIHPARTQGIIQHDSLTDVLRVFRNLIHPARELRDKLLFNVAHANHARAAVDVVIIEVGTWYAAKQAK